MGQAYVRGPVHLYVGTGSSFTPTYLGTSERAPRLSRKRGFDRVMNDLAGSQLAYDYLLEGVEAFVTLKLTRWNQNTLNAIWDPVSNLGGGAAPGNWMFSNPGEIGTLLVTEGVAFPLWVVYSFGSAGPATKVAMNNATNGAIPPGFHLLNCFIEDDSSEGGTDPASEPITFHAVRSLTSAIGSFSLGDTNLVGLPTPN